MSCKRRWLEQHCSLLLVDFMLVGKLVNHIDIVSVSCFFLLCREMHCLGYVLKK